MNLTGPDELYRLLTKLRSELVAGGFHQAAEQLAHLLDPAFTTGSEWLGELGMTVRNIRQQRRLPSHLDQKLPRIMAHVRRTWPAL